MKRLALLFSLSATLVCAADLPGVHTVYLLKMGRGLDQYLASRLTSEHLFQIVTDPKLADTVMTDQIGESFQTKLEELFPTPQDPKATPPPKPKEEQVEGDNPFLGETVNKLAAPPSTFGRSRGTVFLVDAKSRQVVWSAFEPIKSGASKDMDATAVDIVNRLKKALAPPKK